MIPTPDVSAGQGRVSETRHHQLIEMGHEMDKQLRSGCGILRKEGESAPVHCTLSPTQAAAYPSVFCFFPPSCLPHSRHTCHLAQHTPASNSLKCSFHPSGIAFPDTLRTHSLTTSSFAQVSPSSEAHPAYPLVSCKPKAKDRNQMSPPFRCRSSCYGF